MPKLELHLQRSFNGHEVLANRRLAKGFGCSARHEQQPTDASETESAPVTTFWEHLRHLSRPVISSSSAPTALTRLRGLEFSLG